MCGIVAIVDAGNRIDPDALDRATAQLSHRGPDQSGRWIAVHGRVGLGHRRLAIVDLVSGEQPIASEDGVVRAVVNGEFYGDRDLRLELEAKGHRFRSRSDSELLVHLYEDLGPRCVHRLRGEFAFALWDERSQVLFCGRDRFGIKPLVYAERDGTLYVASEAKALFAAGVPARWDHEGYGQTLMVCLHQDRTLFAGVRQLPPGHVLASSGGHVTVSRYWDLDYPVASDRAATDAGERQHVEAVRAALDEAVRLRMRSDVPLACLLSGGLDSASVLGLGAASAPTPIRAFAVSFDRAEYDEAAVARESAEHANAEFHAVALREADLADSVADAVWHGEMVGINAHGAARFLLSDAVRRAGYKVALAGDGSDEAFGGYASTRVDALLHGDRRPDGAAAAGASGPLASVRRRLGFVPAWIEKLLHDRSVFHVLLAPEFAAGLAGRDVYGEFLQQFDVEGQLAGRECVVQSLYLWARSILPNYSLASDRLEMAHGVEVRLPFLDHELFGVIRKVPVALLVREGTGKHVLREAARPYVTTTVYRRPKHSFAAPPTSLSRDGPLRALIEDTLRGPGMASVPFFDAAAVASLLDALDRMSPRAQLKLDGPLFMVLTTVLLHQRYKL